MSRENYSDVVIVGGGIVGSSAAYFLAQRGLSVALIDQGRVGQFASGTNFGNLRRQGRPSFMLPLANRAHKLWPQLAVMLDADLEYVRSGHLRVCYSSAPETMDEFITYASEVERYALNLDVLQGPDLHKRFPFLGPDVMAGSYSPEDGHANPRLVSPAFARAAVNAGAALFENCPVVGVEATDAGYVAACDGGRKFTAPAIVIASGAWGHRLAESLGEKIPMETLGPTMSVTEPLPFFLRPSVGVFSTDIVESIYCRQVVRGNVIIGGGPRNAASIDTQRSRATPENTLNQLHEITRLLPAMAGASVIRTWSGVEGYISDGLPVIGESSKAKGVFYGFGFCGSGFQIGPGVGSVLAELIDSERTDVPIHPYSADRFRGIAA